VIRSIEEARSRFDEYVRLEPQLEVLWDLCRRASPPSYAREDVDDAVVDPFERDELASGRPDDGWCAEDYFLFHIKSKLLALVGNLRSKGPRELQSSEAYETVYDLLINWALSRSCACCIELADEPWLDDDGGAAARW
jgi:hypothetical protein